jgi:hypothetical protein
MEQVTAPLAFDYADYHLNEERYLETFVRRKLRDENRPDGDYQKAMKEYRVVRVSAGEKYSRPAFEIHPAKAESKVTAASN